MRQAEEKAYDVNDELLKQAKWITKKLYLVNVTGKKLREIKEESIQGILSQNGKLIEECNLLRSENENLMNKVRLRGENRANKIPLDEILGEGCTRWHQEKEKDGK